MESQKSKIPKWKRKQNEIQKQTFDDAFEALGTRLEFQKEKKTATQEIVKEKVTP